MKNELKKNLTYKKTMLILSVLCIFCGLLTLLITEMVIPFTAAFLAAIFLFEREGSRRFSYTVCAILILINIAAFFIPEQIPTFASLTVIAFAFLMYRSYMKGSEKSECAFLMTAASALVLGFTVIAIPMFAYGQFDFDVVTEFYGGIISLLREEMILSVNELLFDLSAGGSPILLDADQFGDLFDRQLSMIISYVIIFAFFLVGAAFKLFSIVVSKCADNVKGIFLWRFRTSNVFAYFYFILAVATFFIASSDSIFAITVLNLYNILMFVYFYVGFTVAVGYLSRGRRPVLAFLIVLIAILFFFAYAIELLAVIGAFYTIRTNNANTVKSE